MTSTECAVILRFAFCAIGFAGDGKHTKITITVTMHFWPSLIGLYQIITWAALGQVQGRTARIRSHLAQTKNKGDYRTG